MQPYILFASGDIHTDRSKCRRILDTPHTRILSLFLSTHRTPESHGTPSWILEGVGEMRVMARGHGAKEQGKFSAPNFPNPEYGRMWMYLYGSDTSAC
jgi:hypothetical protein